MKTHKEFMEVPYITTFTNEFEIDPKLKLVLCNIEVFAINERDDSIANKVDFCIDVSNGKSIICPKYRNTKFMLSAKRFVYCTRLEIEKNDYVSGCEKDGKFSFFLKDEVDIDSIWSLENE